MTKLDESRLQRTVGAVATTALVLGTAGCSGSSDESSEDPGTSSCAANEIAEDGKCVLDPYRYEPDEPIDVDNVMYYSTEELQLLTDLPPPPKSGFRIIMEPQLVAPGEDTERCQSWAVPDLTHRWVYTAQVHTTPGLHHANIYGLGIDEAEGPQPHPGCRGRADGQIFGQLSTVIMGEDTSDLIVPAVLFANSTQVNKGGEKYALAEGYAFELEPGIEIMTDVHLQNTTPDELRVETAWDFYTMPKEHVTNPTAMFVYIFLDFLIPPRSTSSLIAECGWAGGDIAAIMPHTHQWATGFSTEFGMSTMRPDGDPEIGGFYETMEKPYDKSGTGLSDSDIAVYHPPVNTDGANSVRFQCHFNNTTDHDMCFGIGENEMCFLFGYVSPPESQRVGVILTEGASCLTLDPATRGQNDFNIASWVGTQPPDVRDKIIDLYAGGGFGGSCPYYQ